MSEEKRVSAFQPAPRGKRVSVIVPTYREAENLPVLIDRLEALRRGRGLDIELIIVDDNSRDGTEGVVRQRHLPWVRLLVRTEERGLSSAVLHGLGQANHENLVVMDADLSHPPEAIPDLLERLSSGADFVIGSRYAPGGSTDTSWGLFRWLNSKVATLMARPLTSVRDPMSGFFALRRETYERAATLNPIGYKIGLELLVKCGCRRVEEVPIHFADRTRGKSKLSAKEQWRYVQHLGRLMKFRYGRRLHLLALLVVLASFLVPTLMFMPQQTYYVDETTQLSGLSLAPSEAARWLGGEDAYRFGVPPDRAPPLSYWAGWLWSQAFGLSELSMRIFGVLCVVGGLIFIFEAGRAAWGLRAGAAAGLLAAMSPNTIANALEIRSYPLYFLLSAGAAFFFVRLFTSPVEQRWRWLLGLGTCCILAIYTHFFGLLLAGALMSAAWVVSIITRERRLAVFAVGDAVLVSAAGLWPFVSSSLGVSGGNSMAEGASLADMARYGYRALFGHPAVSMNTMIAMAGCVGMAALAVVSLWPRNVETSKRPNVQMKSGGWRAVVERNAAAWGLWIALGLGMAVAVAASFAFSAFDPMDAGYNLWRLPALALVIASAVAARSAMARGVALVSMLLVLGASAYGAAQLGLNGRYFAHGPYRHLEALVSSLGANHVVVIQEPEVHWGRVYFPMYFKHRDVPQYLGVHEDGEAPLLRLPQREERKGVEELQQRYAVVVQIREEDWRRLADQVKFGAEQLDSGPVQRAMDASNKWRKIAHHRWTAFISGEAWVYQQDEPLGE